jgi:hypothetical protein
MEVDVIEFAGHCCGLCLRAKSSEEVEVEEEGTAPVNVLE